MAEKQLPTELLGEWNSLAWMKDEEPVHSLEIFTDGAASLNDVWSRAVLSSGWCAVFLSQTAQGVALVGAMYGPVVCDPGSHAHVGVSRLSSSAAELNTLMLAVRGVSVALQLEELGVPWLNTSFVSVGIMQFETRAVANHAQAQMARQWSWAAKNEFAAKYMHVRAQELRAMNSQTWVPNSADGCSAREFLGYGRAFLQGEEAVAISLYDALWWTDQLAKPDPMTERDIRPSVERKLEVCVGSANVRTLSPATDEPEVHSVRKRVLADAFSRKHIDVVGLQETRARNSTFRVWWFHLGCCVWAGRGGDLD